MLLMLVEHPAGTDPQDFHGIIPIHQPGGIWNKILGALDPSALGQGRRPLDDRRGSRNSVRRGGEGHGRRRRQLRGG